MLSEAEIQDIEQELAPLPKRSAGTLEALKVVQRHRGWVSDEALKAVARHLAVSPSELEGVATFYNLIFRQPVGRHVILICDSVSCWIMDHEALLEKLGELLGIGLGDTTTDGSFTLLSTACLGACDRAPALMIDDDLHGPVYPDDLEELLERYRAEERP
jgi:NADH-quinone oxidoreductase subunit E